MGGAVANDMLHGDLLRHIGGGPLMKLIYGQIEDLFFILLGKEGADDAHVEIRHHSHDMQS